MISTAHTPDQDTTAADEELVTGSIGWMAFLRAPHIPLTAWEHD